MQHGFRILEIRLPADVERNSRWKPCFPFDYHIVEQPACPIDGAELEVIAAIVSLSTDERIRIGCCPACGLVGYIDRPDEQCVSDYYQSTWMGESDEQALAIAQAQQRSAERASPASFDGIPLDKSLPFLELGCGYGGTLALLQRCGFTSLFATEHCPARIKAVEALYDIKVNAMPSRAGLVKSHHVLEHAYDPDAFIASAAALQREGDCLELSLPDFATEPSMGVLMFWPHLWSFGHQSLSANLAKHGYGYLSWAADKHQLHVLSRRLEGPILPPPCHGRPEVAVKKLLYGLGLKQHSPQRLIWQRNCDGAAWVSDEHASNVEQAPFPRELLVERVWNSFKTTAPIEIQFEGRVEMFYK